MPPLPVVSGREAAVAFERDGWRITRQRGSHMIMSKPGHAVVLSIPDHPTLQHGTLRTLIRKAGLSVEDFVRLLNR